MDSYINIYGQTIYTAESKKIAAIRKIRKLKKEAAEHYEKYYQAKLQLIEAEAALLQLDISPPKDTIIFYN